MKFFITPLLIIVFSISLKAQGTAHEAGVFVDTGAIQTDF